MNFSNNSNASNFFTFKVVLKKGEKMIQEENKCEKNKSLETSDEQKHVLRLPPQINRMEAEITKSLG